MTIMNSTRFYFPMSCQCDNSETLVSSTAKSAENRHTQRKAHLEPVLTVTIATYYGAGAGAEKALKSCCKRFIHRFSPAHCQRLAEYGSDPGWARDIIGTRLG